MTQAEAARVLGSSPDAVRMLESRAKRRLAAQLAVGGEREHRCDRMAMRVRVRPLPVLACRRLALDAWSPSRS